MGRYEDYMEMHGDEGWGDAEDKREIECCEVCGTDYEKLYHFKNEILCEQCLREKYYYGDAVDIPQEIYCDLCGEVILYDVYCVTDENGQSKFYDEECMRDIADE